MLSIVLAAAGCKSTAAPPQAVVPTPTTLSSDDYNALKAAYLKANPRARVGLVSAVLPLQNRAAISDIPTGDFKKGDVISIVDGRFVPLADGTVVAIDPDLLYVDYLPAPGATRPPAAGDIAVKAQIDISE